MKRAPNAVLETGNQELNLMTLDLYDYLFYLTKHAEINMQNLKAKLVDSEFITDETFLDIEYIVELLDRKFSLTCKSKCKYEEVRRCNYICKQRDDVMDCINIRRFAIVV